TAVRGTLRAGWRRASFDTVAAGSSFGVGGQISAPLGARAAVQAGLGARRLDPDIGRGTTPLTAVLGLRLRPGRGVAGGVGYSHAPFHETAALIARGAGGAACEWSVAISPSAALCGSRGGGGSRQVSDTPAHQLEWHVGLTLTRGWGASNEIALVGLLTNSAVAIATGGTRTEGFRYRTLGLRFQQGL